MENVTKEAQVKVTVHSTPWVTEDGHICSRWAAYYVVAGANPLGPRGGRNGKFLNGRCVSERFAKREAAYDFAKKFAKENRCELI